MKLSFFIPIRTPSIQNMRGGFKMRKMKREQYRIAMNATSTAWIITTHEQRRSKEIKVILCRVASRKLDAHDNLPYALKWIVDGIAEGLGFSDDSDPRLKWFYAQRKGQPKEHGVEVEIEII